MTEMLYLVMMKTHRNFGCLPLDGFKGITPVKEKILQNFNTIFVLFWMVKCILTRNGTKDSWRCPTENFTIVILFRDICTKTNILDLIAIIIIAKIQNISNTLT